MNALLLLVLDSRAPAGGHHHSGGMEAAVTAGFVASLADVEDFCRGRLLTTGRVAAAFAAAGCLAWSDGVDAAEWARLDAEFEARTPAAATRTASRQLGGGLRRLLRAVLPSADLTTAWAACPAPAPHHPLVLGAAVSIAGGDAELAARAAALGTCTSAASAAVRLLGLDPYAVHRMLAALAPELDARTSAAAVSALAGAQALPAHCAPALDLLADVHATQEVRLFAS